MLVNHIMGNCNSLSISFFNTKNNSYPPVKNVSEIEIYLQKYEDKFNSLDNEERTNNFNHNYVLENTPYGNVLLMYDDENNIFLYYCDKTIPNTILETVSKKFIIQFNCKYIYHKKEEEINESINDKEDSELDDVYGKFKQKKKKKMITVIESNINRYKHLGKLVDFHFLQKPTKEVLKEKKISYSDFIKQSN